MIALLAYALASADPVPPGERPVQPYAQADGNAGAAPFKGQTMWHAFHEQAGVDRIVEDFVHRNTADPAVADIFLGQDYVRLRRLLKEQFCYILGGGCTYSGRTMKAAHKDMGAQMKDMNVVVANLQKAMSDEKVPFFAQNRFLAKLAPMKRDVVVR